MSSEKTIVSRSSIPRTALWVSRPKNFTSCPVKVCFCRNLEALRRSRDRRDRAFISVADNVTSRDFRKRLSRLTLSLLRETHEKRHLKRTITAEHYRAQSNADHVAHYGIAIKIHSPERACLRERNLSLSLRYYTARLYRDAFMYPHSAIYTAEIQIYDL